MTPCEYDAAKVEICLDTVSNQSCEDFRSRGTPSECIDLCVAGTDAGTSDAASATDAGSSPCTELDACCPSLDAVRRAQCEGIADFNDPGRCIDLLTDFRGVRECLPPVQLTPSCAQLAACCDQTPFMATCRELVELNRDPECQEYYEQIRPTCGSTDGGVRVDAGSNEGACDELSACCSMAPPDAQMLCRDIAGRGDDAQCAPILMALGDSC